MQHICLAASMESLHLLRHTCDDQSRVDYLQIEICYMLKFVVSNVLA